MESGSNGLRAKVDYLEQRQMEDRIAQASINENLARTTNSVAIIAERVETLQRDYQASLHRAHEVEKSIWKATDRNREMAVRVLLVMFAAALSFVVATGGGHP